MKLCLNGTLKIWQRQQNSNDLEKLELAECKHYFLSGHFWVCWNKKKKAMWQTYVLFFFFTIQWINLACSYNFKCKTTSHRSFISFKWVPFRLHVWISLEDVCETREGKKDETTKLDRDAFPRITKLSSKLKTDCWKAASKFPPHARPHPPFAPSRFIQHLKTNEKSRSDRREPKHKAK